MENQIYHHGVKGMKWGRRRYQNPDGTLTPDGKNRYGGSSEGSVKDSRRTKRLAKAVDRQKKVVESWQDTSEIKDKKGKTLYSKREVKEIRDAAVERLKKLEYKHMISQKRDQINAGESAFGRAYNKLTGADKYQAEIEYNIEKSAKVNKAWRD